MNEAALRMDEAERRKILIVDDIRTDLHLIGKLVKDFGHEVILADSAIQAYDHVDETLDLIIIDAIMPRIDGFEFVKTVRKRISVNIPAIMITSLTGREDRIRAIESGVNDFVSKPVDKVELRVRINSMLKMKAAQDKIRQYQQGLESLVARKTNDLSLALKKMQAVLNSMTDCMLVIDQNRNIIEANQSFVELAEIDTFQDIKGVHFFDLLTETEQEEAFHDLFDTDSAMNQYDITFPQWNHKVFSIVTTHLENESHLIVMRDITEKVRADEQRAQFLSLLSHELRTPLNGIKGFTAIINDEKSLLNEEHAEYFESIDSCCDQLEVIVSEILNFIQLVNEDEEVEVLPISLDTVIAKVIGTFNDELAAKNVQIATTTEGYTPVVNCREVHLREVVRQIIKNAIWFSSQNATITILTSTDDSEVVFKCSDTGVGIPQDKIDRIFDSFYQIEDYSTRTTPGLGLGLTITKRIVELYNGKITIESEHGKGTSVIVTIPIDKKL